LLDAELLAEVYIDLIGARQSQLILASETRDIRVAELARCHGASAKRRSCHGSPKKTHRTSGICRYAGRQTDLERILPA